MIRLKRPNKNHKKYKKENDTIPSVVTPIWFGKERSNQVKRKN